MTQCFYNSTKTQLILAVVAFLLTDLALANTFKIRTCRVIETDFELEYVNESKHPKTVDLGASTAYNNGRHNIESVWHPIPSKDVKGEIYDLTKYDAKTPLPRRFLISDGSSKRAVMSVDHLPGTKLDILLDMFIKSVPGVRDGKVVDHDLAFEFLALKLDLFVVKRWIRGEAKELPNEWDPASGKVSETAMETFRASTNMKAGEGFYRSEATMNVVPFERFLENPCAAFCIQKSILIKLILDRLGVESKIVPGSVITFKEQGFESSGHTWVEAINPKSKKPWVLDAEHERVGQKGEVNEFEADWFWFNGTSRRPNQYFPIMIPTYVNPQQSQQ